MRKWIQKLTSLWSYIVLVVVVIVALSAGTYSWLQQNIKVEETGVPFQLDDSRGVALKGHEIYKRDGKVGAQRVTDMGRINMTEYDTVFTDRNVDTPIIIRVALSDTPKTKDIKWTIKCKDVNKSWTDNSDKSGKYLKYYSNISAVSIGKGYAKLDDLYKESDKDANANEIYNGAVELLDAITPSSFPHDKKVETTDVHGNKTIRYEHEYKDEEISGIIRVNESDIKADGTFVLYIEFKYNSDLVKAYMQDHEHDKTLEQAIDFENDLGFIKFDFVDKYTE